jgi:hypothetical protein
MQTSAAESIESLWEIADTASKTMAQVHAPSGISVRMTWRGCPIQVPCSASLMRSPVSPPAAKARCSTSCSDSSAGLSQSWLEMASVNPMLLACRFSSRSELGQQNVARQGHVVPPDAVPLQRYSSRGNGKNLRHGLSRYSSLDAPKDRGNTQCPKTIVPPRLP